MKIDKITTILLGGALLVFGGAATAQERERDRDRDRVKDSGERNRQESNAEYRFRNEDRDRFSGHYKKDIRQYQTYPDRRHHIRAGEKLPGDYRSRLRPVPRSYYRSVAPPPPGYQFGYYDGYVVAYNPVTQIVADVLDLVGAAAHR